MLHIFGFHRCSVWFVKDALSGVNFIFSSTTKWLASYALLRDEEQQILIELFVFKKMSKAKKYKKC